MVKIYTLNQLEQKVLSYLDKKTRTGFDVNFNSLDLTEEGIAEALNLSIEEVQEALESLEGKNQGYGSSKKRKRIEFLKAKFKIYLPYTKGAKNIKQGLCESGLAVPGNLNIFCAILFLSVSYFLFFNSSYIKNLLGLKNPEQFFVWAAFLGFVSIPIGGYFAHMWYKLTLFTQKIKDLSIIYGFLLFWLH